MCPQAVTDGKGTYMAGPRAPSKPATPATPHARQLCPPEAQQRLVVDGSPQVPGYIVRLLERHLGGGRQRGLLAAAGAAHRGQQGGQNGRIRQGAFESANIPRSLG